MKPPRKLVLNITLTIIFLISSVGANGAIFGADDRRPVAPWVGEQQYGRAVALALLSSNFAIDDTGKVKLLTEPLSRFMCHDEKFAHDPSLDYSCTGFLVAPDLIATAGHCMVNTGEKRNETETSCKAYVWLFDYQTDSSGKFDPAKIGPEQIYRCKQVVYAVNDEHAPFRDYALVQLDRAVTDRVPLPLISRRMFLGQPLAMIGHPFGAPAKVSTNARVLLNNEKRESFVTNLDAVDGNSGSPVIGGQGVVGILVGGTPSQSLIDDKSGCKRVNHCNDDGTQCDLFDENTSVFPGFQQVGSEVQRIKPILDLVLEFQKLEASKATHNK
jgi:V8-like Glu-specific endopeptidase